MTFLLGKEKLLVLKKDRWILVLLCVIPTFFYIGIILALFLTSGRNVMTLYPILLAIVSTLYASYLLFYFTTILRSHLKLRRLCLDAMEKRLYEGDMTVFSIDHKTITVRGVPFKTVTFIHLDDQKESVVYVLEDEIDHFIINKNYKVRTLQSILVAFEEIKDEEDK